MAVELTLLLELSRAVSRENSGKSQLFGTLFRQRIEKIIKLYNLYFIILYNNFC